MKLFSVLKKDLLILLRDRVELAVLFLMPLAFIIPISFALGAGDGYGIKRSNQMLLLPVVNYDSGIGAQRLIESLGESLKLERDYGADLIQSLNLQDDPDCALVDSETPVTNQACVETVGRELLKQTSRPAVLIIPDGFSTAFEAGKPASVTLLYNPAGDSISLQQVEGVLKGAAIKLSLKNQVSGGMNQLNDLVTFAPKSIQQSIANQVNTPQPEDPSPALSIDKVFPAEYSITDTPDTYQQTIPGYTVMYVFFIITSMTSSIRQERLLGTFRRLLGMPVSRGELLGGKMMASMIIGLAQVFILFAVGVAIFKLSLGSDPLAFALLTITLVATATSLGLAASTTRLRGGALAAPLVIAALLGGCMFPLDLMPPFLRLVSLITPQRWALNGYLDLMVRGLGLQEVFPKIAVLVIFAVIFFLFALRRFNFEKD